MQKLSAGVFALCLGLGSTVYANPPVTTSRDVVKRTSASGYAQLDDPEGCVFATLLIDASEDTTKTTTGGTATTTTRGVYVAYYGNDTCRGLSFAVEEDSFPLTAAIGADSFTYTFNIPLRVTHDDAPEGSDGNPSFPYLTGTVKITATGDFEKKRETNITVTENERTVVRSKSDSRDADFQVTNAKLGNKKVKFLFVAGDGSGDFTTTKQATIETTVY